MWKLAAVLGFTAVVIGRCGIEVFRLLQSQQACEMTYMYASYDVVKLETSCTSSRRPTNGVVLLPLQQPAWVEALEEAAARVGVAFETLGHTNYRLWRYTGDGHQGGLAVHSRGNGLAIPVLFIPGNGGSHEMARSLASETARRFSRLGVRVVDPVGVNWYMLDLEAEWSAFDGDILEAQVKFAVKAMKHIATTYNISSGTATMLHAGLTNASTDANSTRRQLQQHPGMIIIAHSMGGMVAADALAHAVQDPDLGPSVAALLVTLGSPLVRPPAPAYPSVQAFYKRAAARSRPVVPIVSIAGGIADIQVATSLTDPEGLTPQGLWRWFSLPAMPGGWCPSRHNSLVWCNQLVVALGQALVDLAQDAVQSLEASRKTSSILSASAKQPQQPGRAGIQDLAAWAAEKGLDPAKFMREARGEEAAVQQPIELSWDWVLRRIDQYLAHPAQPYLAGVLAAGALLPSQALARLERLHQDDPPEERGKAEDEVHGWGLINLAEQALAPVSTGGAACGGANLQWYMQYSAPQLINPRGKAQRALLQVLPGDMHDVPATGRMFTWQLNEEQLKGQALEAGGLRGWVATLSGSQPCSAFRAWLSVKVDYPAHAEQPARGVSAIVSDGGDLKEQLEVEARRALSQPARTVQHDVDVTALAAPLPAVSSVGGWQTRKREMWNDISQGRDYQSRAGWLLLLPSSLVLPLLQPTGSTLLQGLKARNRSGDVSKVDDKEPVVTLLLTLWLAEPSRKPGFKVVAESLPQPAKAAGAAGPQPLPSCVLPEVAWRRWARDMFENCTFIWPPPLQPPQPLRQQQHLVVPLGVPYITLVSHDILGVVSGLVRWLGLYKYAAVRVTQLGNETSPTALEQAAVALGDSRISDCLLPTIILVSNHSSRGGSHVARLVQVSTNRTFHSLEACANGLWSCAAVMAVLDPACQYRVDLVPYAAERIVSLLLANMGRLWVGAQLAALLTVAAVTAETVVQSQQCTGRTQQCAAQSPASLWRLLGRPPLSWEALTVLQVSLLRRPILRFLSAAAFVASVAAALVPRDVLPTTASPLGVQGIWKNSGSNDPTLLPISMTDSSGGVAEVLNSFRSITALAWPPVRQLALLTGLCQQPHAHDCGWGVSSVGLLAPFVPLVPLVFPLQVAPLALLLYLAPPPAPTSGVLSVLDWVALSAASLLVTLFLALVLQVTVAVTMVLRFVIAICMNLIVWLPGAIVLAPLRVVRWLLIGTRSAYVGRVSTVAATEAAAKWAAMWRWVCCFVPLVVLVTLAGAPSAIPGTLLLVSVFNLATTLGMHTAKPLALLSSSSVASSSAWQHLEWRRRIAWLLFYAAYGSCAAPPVAGAFRRLVKRPAAMWEVVAALANLLIQVLHQVLQGRGLDMLNLGLPWVKGVAVSVIMAGPTMRLEADSLRDLPLAATRAFQWGLAQLQEHRITDMLQGALRWLLTTSKTSGKDAVMLQLSDTVAGAGYLLAACHCGIMSWEAAAESTGFEIPWLYNKNLWKRRVVVWLPVSVGGWLLALAWWLGAMEAAHVAAAVVAGAQLFLRQW